MLKQKASTASTGLETEEIHICPNNACRRLEKPGHPPAAAAFNWWLLAGLLAIVSWSLLGNPPLPKYLSELPPKLALTALARVISSTSWIPSALLRIRLILPLLSLESGKGVSSNLQMYWFFLTVEPSKTLGLITPRS